MTQQITFQYALKLLNQKEEDFLQQASQVRERKTQLLGALRFLGILDLLDFPEDSGDPEEEDKKNPARTIPETIDHFGQTESDEQSSKPSPDFSSKTGPLQGDSIYERAHQQANQDRAYQQARQEAMVEMRKKVLALGPQTLFPNPKELLNAQGNDPSEWLLDRANASRDEILTGSTTLKELLENLDNLDGIRFNQNIIREFLGGIFNSDSTDKEPGNFDPVEKINDHWNSLGSVPGYRSTTEEIGPGTADQGSDIREPAVPYSNIKDQPSPDSDIREPASPYPYSNIKDRPIPDPDSNIWDRPIPDPDSNIWDPAVGDRDIGDSNIWDAAVPDSNIRGPAAPDSDPAVPDSLMELRPNFKKTPNLGEKMKRVGIAAKGKTLSPNEVTKLLIDQGQYRSRMKNIRYQVRWIMRENPLQYEKIGEDTFRFIGPVRKTSGNLPASPLRMPPRRIQTNHRGETNPRSPTS